MECVGSVPCAHGARAPFVVCSTTAFSESVCFLQITPEECMSLATAANGLPGTVLGEGARPVIIAGVKYMVLRADENVFYVRQVGLSSWPRPRSANPCLGCLCQRRVPCGVSPCIRTWIRTLSAA